MFEDDETLTMPTVYVYADGQYLDLDAYMMMGSSPSFADGELRLDTITVQFDWPGSEGNDPSPDDGIPGLKVWQEDGVYHFYVEKDGWFDTERDYLPREDELRADEGVTGTGDLGFLELFMPFEDNFLCC